MFKKLIKGVFCLFSVICLITPFFVYANANEKNEAIIIACVESVDELYQNTNGIVSGYIPEMIDILDEYLVSDVEFVYMTWADAMEALNQHQIDFIFTGSNVEEREGIYEFTKFQTGLEKMYLYTLPEKAIYYGDYEGINHKKIGILSFTAYDTFFEMYTERLDLETEVIYYDQIEELEQALDNNEIDFIASSNIFDHKDYRVVLNYGSSPYYAMTYKDNPKLDEMDFALRQAYSEKKEDLDELYIKYFENEKIYNPLFTKEDSLYIQEKKSITIGLYDNNSPLSEWVDNNPHGILVDILNKVSRVSGLEINYVKVDKNLLPEENIYQHQLDLLVSLDTSYRDEHLMGSLPIFTSDYVVVSKGTIENFPLHVKDIAIYFDENEILDLFSSDFPKAASTMYETPYECLSAVMREDVDMALINSYVYNFEFKNPYFNDLEVKTYYTKNIATNLVGLKDDKNQLITVINKAIDSVTEEDLKLFILAHSNHVNRNITLYDYFYPYRLPLIIIGVLSVLCLVLVYFVSRVKRKEANQKIEIRSVELANKTKSNFLSQMSHEIRTPMNAIVNLSDLAITEIKNPEKMEERLEDINRSSKYLVALVNDILDMSKIESNMMSLHPTPTSLVDVYRTCEKILNTQLMEKEIQLHFFTNLSSSVYLLVDSLRFQQILMNILTNAIKFSYPKGNINVSLKKIEENQNRMKIELKIKDEGIGMSEEFLPSLFNPFCQEKSNQSDITGTGLGMSIVKSLVDLNQGTIEVESAKTKGTTFTINFDFDVVDKKHMGHETIESTSYHFSDKKRVLLVEDNELNIKVAKAILEKGNYEVDCATNGLEGVQMFAKSEVFTYDAIIIDIKMPVMDGIEATREIRSIVRQDATILPIIAISADIFDDERRHDLDEMMSGYLNKPIEVERLYETLYQLITKYEKTKMGLK